MRTRYGLLLAGGALLAAFIYPGFSSEEDPDAKLREAMRQKMKDLDAAVAQSGTAQPPEEQPAAAPPAPTPAPAEPATQASPPPSRTEPVPPAADPEQTERLRAAMDTSMAGPEGPQSGAKWTDVPPPADPAKQQKLQQALRAKTGQVDAERPVPQPAGEPKVVTAPVAKAAATPVIVSESVTRNPFFAGMTAPAPRISTEQQSQLAALLSQYRADAITPEEYHQKRAEILAGP